MKNLILTLVIAFGVLSVGIAQELQVVSVSPTSHSLSTDPTHNIEINFNQAVNPATVNGDSFMVFGRWSGPMMGEFSFSNDNQTLTFTPEGPFFYGEYIMVMMTKTIASIDGDILTFGYQYNYWTKTLPGYLNLPEVDVIEMREPGEVWIQCYGAYAGDINDDGHSDLTVVNEQSEDLRIMLNDGNGGYSGFAIKGLPGSTKPSTNEGADFNHDGFIDLAVGSTQGTEVSVLMGNGDGSFNDEVVYNADQGVRGLAILDMNADGYADIATANRVGSNMAFFLNDQNGGFGAPDFMDTPPAAETATMAGDFNNDGIMDLAVGAYTGSAVMVLTGDGVGGFQVTAQVSVNSNPWMVGVGDVNGDGNCDLVSANAGGANMSVHFGDGNGGISEGTYYATGNFPLAIDLGDLDGDGDLDMISSNYSGGDFTFYENDGTGNYVNPITYEAYEAGSCALFHDRDNDGIMDLTGIDEIADVVILYQNSTVTELYSESSSAFSIFPNPTAGPIQIQGLNAGEVLHVLDITGRVCAQIRGNGMFDLSDLLPGTYVVSDPTGIRAAQKVIRH